MSMEKGENVAKYHFLHLPHFLSVQNQISILEPHVFQIR